MGPLSTKTLTNLAKLVTRGRPPVGTTPSDVVHRENKWTLLRYQRPAGAPARGAPVLLVPSLINRHYVLDLLPGRSFAEWMVAAGHDVFIVDWGKPGREDRLLDFDTIVDRYVGRALRRTTEVAQAERAHLLGYCLGGTLATIHAALHPERVASLVAMAAPIRFHDEGLLSRWTRSRGFDVRAIADAFGNIPWPLMQLSFELLKPTLALSKGVQLLDRAWDDQFLDAFHAIETWGHDNISFPGAAYVRYIEALYQDDALVRGALSVSGRRVALADVTCPTLAVTFEHDHIVPHASAAVLLEHVGADVKRQLHLVGGHVGAVVSQKASKTLWPELSAWWRAHDPVRAPAPSAPALGPRSTAPRGAPSARATPVPLAR